MEPQNQNIPQNMPAQGTPIQPMQPMRQNKSSIGSIIGTVIIIAIIILGGLYFWGKRVEETKLNQNLVSETTSSEPQPQDEATVIKSISPSDDLQSIQNDLNNTNLNNLDREISTQPQ